MFKTLNKVSLLILCVSLIGLTHCQSMQEFLQLMDKYQGNREAPPTIKEHASTVSQVIPGKGNHKAKNIIFITADTLRADFLSCYGNQRILTPFIDRLSASGVLFEQAIPQATTTSPSHASIFTGLYLQDHQAYSNFEAIGDDVKTIFEILVGRGYRTHAIVNMPHLNKEVSNITQGVQDISRGDRPRRAHQTIESFIHWMDGVGDEQPFISWLHFVETHTPYRPPPPYNRFYYEGDEGDPGRHSLQNIWPLLPKHMSDHPFFQQWLSGITDVNYVIAQYQGAVSYLDDEIGFLLEQLAARRKLTDTAIVFTSDHGESLGEHNLYFIHYGLYESTARVPLIMYFPGNPRQGIVINQVVELVDVMPTLLDYLDLPIPHNIRGKSLWPHIRGKVDIKKEPALIEHAGRHMMAVRTERYKYIKQLRNIHVVPPYRINQGKEELYDLKEDPYERFNIIKKRPVIARKMRMLLREKTMHKIELQKGQAKIDPQTEEILRSLGYIR